MALQKTYDDVIDTVNEGLWNEYKSRHDLKTEQDVLTHFSKIYNVDVEEAKRNLETYKTVAIMIVHGEYL